MQPSSKHRNYAEAEINSSSASSCAAAFWIQGFLLPCVMRHANASFPMTSGSSRTTMVRCQSVKARRSAALIVALMAEAARLKGRRSSTRHRLVGRLAAVLLTARRSKASRDHSSPAGESRGAFLLGGAPRLG